MKTFQKERIDDKLSPTSSGHLEARDGLEVHHLQHLLGLCVHLDDVLGRQRLENPLKQINKGK